MAKRVLLGCVVGGIVIFVVASIWHMALGLGEIGIKNLPGEDAVVSVMRGAIREPGFYFFPGMERSPGMTKEQRQAEEQKWAEKYRVGPSGILIYRSGGEEFRFGRLLFKQFLIGLAAALVVSWLLALAAGALPSYSSRVLFVALVSVFAGVVMDLPYWNWYGFPANYTLAHLAGVVITWGVTGLVLAAIVKRPA